MATVCTAVFAFLTLVPVPGNAATTQVPPYFTIRPLVIAGSGCPLGSTAVSRATDRVFTVTYSRYIAEAGGGARAGDFRKNCHMGVKVDVPSGWAYGITEVDYRGYAHLGDGALGTLMGSYYLPGAFGPHSRQYSLRGPMDDSYEFSDVASAMTYAPCRFAGSLNINTSLEVNGGQDPAFVNQVTVDSLDQDLTTIYRLGFKRC